MIGSSTGVGGRAGSGLGADPSDESTANGSMIRRIRLFRTHLHQTHLHHLGTSGRMDLVGPKKCLCERTSLRWTRRGGEPIGQEFGPDHAGVEKCT